MAPGNRVVRPARRYDCTCLGCGEPVVARMGEVLVHHWSHVAGTDDHARLNRSSGGHPMTAWHREWRDNWP